MRVGCGRGVCGAAGPKDGMDDSGRCRNFWIPRKFLGGRTSDGLQQLSVPTHSLPGTFTCSYLPWQQFHLNNIRSSS